MFRYAQLDANNKVMCVSQLSEEVNAANMIPIDQAFSENRNAFFCYYANGEFTGYYVTLNSDKPEILPNDIDSATVIAKVYDYLDNPINYSGEIDFDVEGERFSLPATDGEAVIEVTSDYANVIDISAWIANARAGGCMVIAKNN